MKGFLEVLSQALLFTTPSITKWYRSATLSRHSWVCSSRYQPSSDDKGGDDGTVFFNHAGASPSPDCVVDRVVAHMKLEQRVGGYTAAEMVCDEVQDVYRNIARLLACNSTDNIALVESATVGWTRSFYSLADFQHRRNMTHRKRVILVSEAEYAANVVAACEWAKDHRQSDPTWTVLMLPSSLTASGGTTGKVNLQVLEDMLQGNYLYWCHRENTMALLGPKDIAIVCVTHIPTNSGIINDVEGIGSLVKDYNDQQDTVQRSIPSILYLVDACQSVGHRKLDVNMIHCHGLVGTGRKFLRGPRGTGFLYSPISFALRPHHVDHFGVPVVGRATLQPVEDWIQVRPKPGARRFEFYESNIANKLGLGEAVRYALEDVGIDAIQATASTLAQTLYSKLQSLGKVQLHHPPECGIVTFHVSKTDSYVVKKLLDGIFETSVVPSTSTPLDGSDMPDLIRVSLSYHNTHLELDSFRAKLQEIIDELT